MIVIFELLSVRGKVIIKIGNHCISTSHSLEIDSGLFRYWDKTFQFNKFYMFPFLRLKKKKIVVHICWSGSFSVKLKFWILMFIITCYVWFLKFKIGRSYRADPRPILLLYTLQSYDFRVSFTDEMMALLFQSHFYSFIVHCQLFFIFWLPLFSVLNNWQICLI